MTRQKLLFPGEDPSSRRRFLQRTGFGLVATGAILTFNSCSDDDEGTPALPDPPSDLAADNSTSGQIVLTWEDNSSNETGFELQRSTSSDAASFTELTTLGADETTYTDTTVTTGQTYYYRVRAVLNGQYSAFSNTVDSAGMVTVDLGSGDVGILNYAYALEQLEAAFYIMATDSMYDGASAMEMRILNDIANHEVAHKDFFKGALATNAIQGLTPDFSAIDFSSKASVLGAAKTFENLGVAAYNGAGPLITNADYLLVAGKIVSVEARHAAVINTLLAPGSTDFASNADSNGLDGSMMPADVLTAAQTYIVETIDGTNLPTS